MKILFCTPAAPQYGSSSSLVHELAARLATKHHVAVLERGASGGTGRFDVGVYIGRLFDWAWAAAPLALCRRRVWFATGPESTRLAPGEREDARKFDAVIAPSQFSRAAMIASGVQARAVPLGTDMPLLARAPRAAPIGLYVGSNRPHKNQDVLYEAYAGGEPLIIRGAALRELPNVRHVDELAPAELRALFAEADYAVLPSRGESFSLFGLEALASGMPLVCPRWGGVMEYASDTACWWITGLLVPTNDELHIGEWFGANAASLRAIVKTIAREGTGARAEAARPSVARFTWEASADALARELEAVCTR